MNSSSLIFSQGLLETRALEFATKHPAVWETFIIKPGGVVPRKMTGNGVIGFVTTLGAVMGENFSVRIEEVGAFMAYLAVNPKGEEPITLNARIVRKGRELLNSTEK